MMIGTKRITLLLVSLAVATAAPVASAAKPNLQHRLDEATVSAAAPTSRGGRVARPDIGRYGRRPGAHVGNAANASTAVLVRAGKRATTTSQVGPSFPASVTCDSLAHTVTISAMFGAGQAYESQRLAYRLYIYKSTQQGWIGGPLWIDGQTWKVFTHNRVQWYWDPHVLRYQQQIDYITSDTNRWELTPGRYYLYVQYLWEVGMNSSVWIDRLGNRFVDRSPWDATTEYRHPSFAGTFATCDV